MKKLGGILFGIIAVLIAASCGAASPEGALESVLEASGAGDVDLDLESGQASVSVGDADISYGAGQGRPDWLESKFDLPEGLDIQVAINDESSGERAIVGVVTGGSVEAIVAQQTQSLQAAGYEQLGDSMIFVAPGARPIEVNIEENGADAYFSFEHRFETEQVLRDAYAPIEGTGTMAVQIGDENYTFEGPCSLRSSSGQFETGDDIYAGQGSITIDIRDGEQDYILANVGAIDGETIHSWTMLQVDEAGNYPNISMTGSGFTVDGFMTSFTDGSTAPVAIAVTCPG